MAAAEDTFYYPSAKEEQYHDALLTITEQSPHALRHYLDLFPVYASRRAFIRFLAHYELFCRTIDLPGHYADFGVYFGKSLFSWHTFLEILSPTATHKKVIGFDTFAGFPSLAEEDGEGDERIDKKTGGLSSESFLDEFKALLKLRNDDCVLPAERGSIVQGDVCQTFPDWLEAHPEARFCLMNIDMDIYDPTLTVLEHGWDRLVPGGVLILDEYGTSQWPGETRAWDDFAKKHELDIVLQRFPWANAPGAYVIKP